jgi:hypothetical protein
MPFPADVAELLLVKSARHCCLCRQFKGQKIEIHHIVPEAHGGKSSFDNGLPVCFDCHAEVNSYNDQHPRGRKFRPSELKQLRDEWFRLVAEGKSGGSPSVSIVVYFSPKIVVQLETRSRASAATAVPFLLELRTGDPPASISAPDSGILLVTAQIDSAGSGSGVIDDSGSAGHFRIRDLDGNVVSQGRVTAPGQGGEMEMDDNTCVAAGTLVVARKWAT